MIPALSPIKRRLAHLRDRAWAKADAIKYKKVFQALLTPAEAAKTIREMIEAESPMAMARMGRTEARIVGEYLFRSSRYSAKSIYQAHRYSGIFPVSQQFLDYFADFYGRALEALDILAFWPTEFQAALVNNLPQLPSLVDRLALEPFLWQDPWSAVLAGRKVLVVHPFREAILDQYSSNRQNLFCDHRVLPEFALQVIRAPQCAGCQTEGFASWSEAYKSLEDDVMAADFEIAILGCGAFGLPLAAAIKHSGRKALHLGGVTQVLFGVSGKRWLEDPAYQSLFNQYWVRPSGTALTSAMELVDGACYW